MALMSNGGQPCECKTHLSNILNINRIERFTDFLTDADLAALVPTSTQFCDRLDKCRYEVEDHWMFTSFQKIWTLFVLPEMEKGYSIVEKRRKWQKFNYALKAARMKRAILYVSPRQ